MTEKELIRGCIKRDAKSQYLLFEQYSGRMMSVCLRYASDRKEAEDILQESFVRVFNYIDKFRSEGSLEGWMKRIVVNVALRMLEHKKIRFLEIDADLEEIPSFDADALTNLGTDELLRMISGLSEGYRIIFNLYVIEGYDHNEIAAMLDISPGTSRSQLSKAKRILKQHISALQKTPNGYAKR